MGLAIGIPFVAILAAENALHIWDRPSPDDDLARTVVRESTSAWETAKIAAADGVPLEAWVFTPSQANGSAVILLHGVGDTRRGVWAKASFLLKNGFTVLTPDARGHGSSGGSIITYGVRESGDVRAWADWLFQHRPITRLYGFGFSMGAAILLQSLPGEPRFRAVIAEAPFCTFEQIAFDRMTQMAGLPLVVAWPIVKLGVLYTRVRYSVNLNDASPAAATQRSHVPTLLIHGTLDTNISIRHSRQLAAANRELVLWEVPGGHHIDVESVTAPAFYETKVTEWFRSHP
jgi:alpha-beta hydrolase superfamily lysophospholipase